MKTHYSIGNDKLAKGFLRTVKSGSSKIKQYLLNRVGLASHEIRVGINSDPPFAFGKLVWNKDHRDYQYYDRSFGSSFIYMLNTSKTVPAITSFGIIVVLPKDSPLRFRDPRIADDSDDLSMFWQHDFIDTEDEKEIALREIPTLPQGRYLNFPEHKFLTNVWWPDIIETYGYHEWIDKQDIPKSLGEEMEANIKRTIKNMEVWLYVILDSDELLPFKWSYQDKTFMPGFWTDGTVVK
ncbi:hypothetical protein ACJJIL_08620 [Microbulbifer sp. EKSA005]|uniref:hypothetical protein n=1 Tax=Microbulbifer sp. EKSA005 TaxID=3243364 RepID=UPI0040423571